MAAVSSPSQAYQAIHRAVAVGALVRPNHCSSCGSTYRIQGHHANGYEPDHYLDVVWLCQSCHRQAHVKPEPYGLVLVQVRLDAEILLEIDHQAVDWKLTRGPAMERVLRAGLDALKVEAG